MVWTRDPRNSAKNVIITVTPLLNPHPVKLALLSQGVGGGEGWVIDLVRGVARVRGCVGGAGTLHGADTKLEP